MSDFPSVEPVLTAEFVLGRPLTVGQVANGASMICVLFTGGTLKSTEGGILSGLVDARCISGFDCSRADPSQEFTRLNVKTIFQNKDESMIYLSYDALIRITQETALIFRGHENAVSTSYGNIFAQMRFETGNPKLKALEENVLVGSGRFVVESGTALRVEYNIGRLVTS